MRIERVEGNRKIRVMLSQDDLNEMNINIHTLTPDSPELHSFLFRVMEFIKRETGFNAQHGQVMVEASPESGGITLTVTKIGTARERRRIDPKTVRVKKKTASAKLYRFPDFNALEEYLRGAESTVLGEMCLYSYNGAYFMAAKSADRRLSEFADRIPLVGTSELFLSEHGKLIACGEKLINMADGVKNLK